MRYEQLRARVIKCPVDLNHGGGVAILIRRGLLVWIRSLTRLEEREANFQLDRDNIGINTIDTDNGSSREALAVDSGNRSIVLLLVDMVLNNHQQGQQGLGNA